MRNLKFFLALPLIILFLSTASAQWSVNSHNWYQNNTWRKGRVTIGIEGSENPNHLMMLNNANVTHHPFILSLFANTNNDKAINIYGKKILQGQESNEPEENFQVMGSGQTFIGTSQNRVVNSPDGPQTSAGIWNAMLWVNGNIVSEEVTVANYQNWPDYVFAKEYNLMPLEELERFIQSNKHLPNIPSAKEIESKKGFQVADMSKKLLEKTEELTLYTIDISHQVNALKETNSLLQKENQLLRESLQELEDKINNLQK